ncbi:MAG: Rsd/AlgQ family anti-sigma factor [Gammaproteobacteria bacterium]
MVELQSQTAVDRRANSIEKLATLVGTRTDTLARYTRLAGQRPFSEQADILGNVQEFCQTLIDYTASAHFQLYRYITEKVERRTAVIEIANSVYPHIARTTDTILSFNDKYEKASSAEEEQHLLENLDADLSSLGEALAERIHFEDQVINALTQEAVH